MRSEKTTIGPEALSSWASRAALSGSGVTSVGGRLERSLCREGGEDGIGVSET